MPAKKKKTLDWTVADRLSVRIVDAVNAELETMRRTKTIDAPQLLAGQLFGLMAIFQTLPLQARPIEIEELERAVKACLTMMAEMRERQTSQNVAH